MFCKTLMLDLYRLHQQPVLPAPSDQFTHLLHAMMRLTALIYHMFATLSDRWLRALGMIPLIMLTDCDVPMQVFCMPMSKLHGRPIECNSYVALERIRIMIAAWTLAQECGMAGSTPR